LITSRILALFQFAETYLKYRNGKSMQEFKKYKKIRNRLNQRIKDLEERYWGKFTSDMEHDLYGSQKKI